MRRSSQNPAGTTWRTLPFMRLKPASVIKSSIQISIDKAAVLACHVAWNHPLPHGNKRVGWACLVAFLDLNGFVWDPDPPVVDEAESAVIAMAAHKVDEAWMATWLRERTRRVEQ
jgi:prophage maintenance system killer protein